MLDSLWGDEFKVESNESEILSKIKSTKNSVKVATSNKKLSLSDKLENIKTNVYRILGNRVNDVEVIRDKQVFRNYIDTAINNGLISIDTETNNSLDPLTCKLMGLCLYTPGLKAVYIPVNHINMYDNTKLSNQLTEQDIHDELIRLKNTKIIFHNAKFDYQVIKCTCNVDLDIYFDTMICAKILDENESASLKSQYIIHINQEQEKYSIEHLFEKLSYEIIDPNLFVLYAATDALITYELYKYQVEQLNKSENSKLCKILFDIEIPFIKVIANMELRGIKIDNEYSQRLSIKYHKKLDELQLEIDKELENLRPIIDKWRLTREANEKIEKSGKLQKSKSEQLEDKVNLDSPTQLSILLYDVLKVGVIDKKTPRGTGSEILEKIDIPLCKLLVERKAILKLSKDFIDALPEKINDIDGRIHCEFNQYGAATGRLSSSNPNLQQIPSHDKSVRMMFTASDGYKLVGSDYSAQEPRLTAFMSHDKNMLQAYLDKKDLYAVIASLSFNKPYEECLEFYPEGTKLTIDNKEIICGYKTNQNKAGKERRSQAKAVLLG